MNKNKNTPILDNPLNSNERFLYNIAVRLDIIIHMLSSLIETYAEKITFQSQVIKLLILKIVEVEEKPIKPKDYPKEKRNNNGVV